MDNAVVRGKRRKTRIGQRNAVVLRKVNCCQRTHRDNQRSRCRRHADIHGLELLPRILSALRIFAYLVGVERIFAHKLFVEFVLVHTGRPPFSCNIICDFR